MTDILVLGTWCEAHHCISCGVAYTVPSVVIKEHREKGGFHSCPNGHQQGWSPGGDTEMNRLRRERDRLKQDQARLEQEKRELDAEANRQLGRAQAAEKKLASHKKRAAAGVCPCCNRTVSQMARHMKTKHPEFGSTNVVKLEGRAS